MTKRRHMLLQAMLITTAVSVASPVLPGHKKTLPTTNGTVITAEQNGDEFLSWWESDNGDKYVISEDGMTFNEADFTSMQNNAQIMRAPIRNNSIGGEHITYTGQKKGLIILVEFADKKFQKEHGLEYYNNVANATGFSNSEGYVGSVHDYYTAQSNGKFELTFDIKGPVTVSHEYAYYGANSDGKKDVNVGEMLKEATDAIADQTNFSDYDWDGDGVADQVFYMYAGLGEAASDDPNTIWPHMYYMRYRGGVLTYSTGSVNRYACASELLGVMDRSGKYTDQTRPSGIGTICHEFSHCLGFPDMYDTNGQKLYGMGYYDLLANGNYLNNGLTPPNFTAWERIYAGWTEPIVLEKATSVERMVSATDYGRPFIMYNDNNHDEYYLFENRQKTGWDSKLYGCGLMITHVDYDKTRWTNNRVNASGQDHQRCTIFHADNEEGLSTASSIRGDLYPYTGKNIDMTDYINNSLTDSSTPAATLWNSHDVNIGTTYMGKPITEITQNEDGTIAFNVMGGDSNNIVYNDNATGIVKIESSQKRYDANYVYSLDGRTMGGSLKDMPHGIYIVEGKKVVK